MTKFSNVRAMVLRCLKIMHFWETRLMNKACGIDGPACVKLKLLVQTLVQCCPHFFDILKASL